MTSYLSKQSVFRERLLNGEELIGMFVKTPNHMMVEVMGNTELDFLVLDQEHSPFDLFALDTCLLAGRSADMPMMVRIQQNTGTGMLYPLDCGATGVIVPHVATPEKAKEIARAADTEKETVDLPVRSAQAGMVREKCMNISINQILKMLLLRK